MNPLKGLQITRENAIESAKIRAGRLGKTTLVFSNPNGLIENFIFEAPGKKVYRTPVDYRDGIPITMTTALKEDNVTLVEYWTNAEELYPPWEKHTWDS